MNLQSSSTLGTGSVKTHKELLDQQEDKDVRHTISGHTSKRKRKQNGPTYTSAAFDDSDEDFDLDEGMQVDKEDDLSDDELGKSRSKPIIVVDSGFSTAPDTSEVVVKKIAEVGSALRRDANGQTVKPVVKKSKGTKVFIPRTSCISITILTAFSDFLRFVED